VGDHGHAFGPFQHHWSAHCVDGFAGAKRVAVSDIKRSLAEQEANGSSRMFKSSPLGNYEGSL
jgi:hypothetical protein